MENTIYYLDWKKVNKLDNEERGSVHNYYRDMISYFSNNQTFAAKSIQYTLLKAGFIKNASEEQRDNKIDRIINDKEV